MGYTTQTYVQQQFNTYGLTSGLDDDRDGSADSGLWAQALKDADYEAESYIIPNYPTLTVAAVEAATVTCPEIVKVMAARLGASNILRRQGKRDPFREDTIAWFEKLMEGKAILQGFTEAGLPESNTHEVTRTFSYRSLDDMGEEGPAEFSEGNENDANDA